MTASAIQVWTVPAAICYGEEIVRLNQAFLDMLDVSGPESVRGREISAFVRDDLRDEFVARLEGLQRGDPELPPLLSTRLVRPDGVEVEAAITRIPGESSVTTIWTLVVSHYRELSAGGPEDGPDTCPPESVEFGELAVALLHDLGQPITAIQAAGEIVSARISAMEVADELHRLVTILSSAGDELSRQHGIIRNYVRHRRASVQNVLLVDLLSESIHLVRGLTQGNEIRIDLDAAMRLRPVELDPGLMHLSLVNTLTQAVRFVRAADLQDRRILISLRDIPEGAQEISVRFSYPTSRGEVSPRHFDTSRRVVEMHKGRFTIEVPSEESVCLRIRLPEQGVDPGAGMR